MNYSYIVLSKSTKWLRHFVLLKPLLGLIFNSQKCCHTFVNWYKRQLGQIKTQKMSGSAKRCHSSFGFYVLSKTYTATGCLMSALYLLGNPHTKKKCGAMRHISFWYK